MTLLQACISCMLLLSNADPITAVQNARFARGELQPEWVRFFEECDELEDIPDPVTALARNELSQLRELSQSKVAQRIVELPPPTGPTPLPKSSDAMFTAMAGPGGTSLRRMTRHILGAAAGADDPRPLLDAQLDVVRLVSQGMTPLEQMMAAGSELELWRLLLVGLHVDPQKYAPLINEIEAVVTVAELQTILRRVSVPQAGLFRPELERAGASPIPDEALREVEARLEAIAVRSRSATYLELRELETKDLSEPARGLMEFVVGCESDAPALFTMLLEDVRVLTRDIAAGEIERAARRRYRVLSVSASPDDPRKLVVHGERGVSVIWPPESLAERTWLYVGAPVVKK